MKFFLCILLIGVSIINCNSNDSKNIDSMGKKSYFVHITSDPKINPSAAMTNPNNANESKTRGVDVSVKIKVKLRA